MPCILIIMDTLAGAVERITYYNPENGYTVLRLKPDSHLGQRLVNKTALNSSGLRNCGGQPAGSLIGRTPASAGTMG